MRLTYLREELPGKFDLVIGTAKRVFEYGAYLYLDEYGIEAFLPLNEIAPTRIENIRDFVREGRKYVVKVIRVDRAKRHVDVSLKRVSDGEKKNKILEWKRFQRGLKLLELAALESNTDLKEVKRMIPKFEREFGDLYGIFEEVRKRGPDILIEMGISDALANKIYEKAVEYIKLPTIEVGGILRIISYSPDGIEVIKKSLLYGIDSVSKNHNVKIEVKSAGVPNYLVKIIADNYKKAEKALNDFLTIIEKNIKSLSKNSLYSFSFKRIRD